MRTEPSGEPRFLVSLAVPAAARRRPDPDLRNLCGGSVSPMAARRTPRISSRESPSTGVAMPCLRLHERQRLSGHQRRLPDHLRTGRLPHCAMRVCRQIESECSSLLAATYFGDSTGSGRQLRAAGPIRARSTGNVYIAGRRVPLWAQVNPSRPANGPALAFVAKFDRA